MKKLILLAVLSIFAAAFTLKAQTYTFDSIEISQKIKGKVYTKTLHKDGTIIIKDNLVMINKECYYYLSSYYKEVKAGRYTDTCCQVCIDKVQKDVGLGFQYYYLYTRYKDYRLVSLHLTSWNSYFNFLNIRAR